MRKSCRVSSAPAERRRDVSSARRHLPFLFCIFYSLGLQNPEKFGKRRNPAQLGKRCTQRRKRRSILVLATPPRPAVEVSVEKTRPEVGQPREERAP